jgi:hypothetical protein
MDAEDLEDLRLFVARADELLSTRLLRTGTPLSFTINFDKMRGLRFRAEEPNPDDLRSFLNVLRHFLLDREPTNVGKTHNLCQRVFTSDELRGYLRHARDTWKKEQKQGGIKIVFNEKDWTPEYIARLWLNGWYFHNDRDKRALLRALAAPQSMLVRHVFISFMLDTARVVAYMSNVIRVALKDGLVR